MGKAPLPFTFIVMGEGPTGDWGPRPLWAGAGAAGAADDGEPVSMSAPYATTAETSSFSDDGVKLLSNAYYNAVADPALTSANECVLRIGAHATGGRTSPEINISESDMANTEAFVFTLNVGVTDEGGYFRTVLQPRSYDGSDINSYRFCFKRKNASSGVYSEIPKLSADGGGVIEFFWKATSGSTSDSNDGFASYELDGPQARAIADHIASTGTTYYNDLYLSIQALPDGWITDYTGPGDMARTYSIAPAGATSGYWTVNAESTSSATAWPYGDEFVRIARGHTINVRQGGLGWGPPNVTDGTTDNYGGRTVFSPWSTNSSENHKRLVVVSRGTQGGAQVDLRVRLYNVTGSPNFYQPPLSHNGYEYYNGRIPEDPGGASDVKTTLTWDIPQSGTGTLKGWNTIFNDWLYDGSTIDGHEQIGMKTWISNRNPYDPNNPNWMNKWVDISEAYVEAGPIIAAYLNIAATNLTFQWKEPSV